MTLRRISIKKCNFIITIVSKFSSICRCQLIQLKQIIHADIEHSVGEEVLEKFKCFYIFKCQQGLSQLVYRTFCCNPFVLFYFLFVFDLAMLTWNRFLMHYKLKFSVFNIELKTECVNGYNCLF